MDGAEPAAGDLVQRADNQPALRQAGPVANFSRPMCELREKAARSNFWLWIGFQTTAFLPLVASMQVP
jgi:hypothetical protein